MTDDDRPDWRKRTDATLRELEALEQTMAEQVARMRLMDKDIMTMDLKELRARVLVMETRFTQAARDLGRIGQRLDELSQGEGDASA